MAQLAGCRPAKQKVTSLIPGQGAWLGCMLRPSQGVYGQGT